MKKLKKYLPIILLLAFVALLIAIAIGVSRRGAIAPTAPVSKPAAGSCLLTFDITPLNCNGTCTETAQCGTGMNCYKANPTDASGFCRNVNCQTASSCVCATPTPTPTPPPVCNDACTENPECGSGMTCYKAQTGDTSGFCRNPSCTTSSTCGCSTPTPTPTDTPKGGFYIRKYYDHNGNGTQDSGDEGLSWNFVWTSDDGVTWIDYQTDGAKLGEGGVVYLNGGTKVQIKEKSADGWVSTTATTANLTIKINDNQLMVFGNWHGASPTPTPTPVLSCNSACQSNSDCPSSMNCVDNACRNPSCSGSASCICATSPTPTPTPTPETLPRSGAIDDTLKLVAAGIGAVLLGMIGLLAL